MLGSNRLEDRLASHCVRRSLMEQNLHTSGTFCVQCRLKFQLQYSLDGNISAESFPFFQKSFFFKDRIEEITRFVAAVNNFPWEINSSNTTALHARCTFRRVRNKFQPQTSLWKYEKTMLIKIVAMFRNLFISSFDATIRVKRAFHPSLASRGFASHIFLVYF